MITIIKEIPTKVFKNKSKEVNLNLNIYRNLHHFTNNTMKVNYKKLITEIFKDVESIEDGVQIELIFTYYHNNKRKFDLSNICSIIEKYTNDALVSLGIIKDDNITIIPKVTYLFGGINKGQSACILEIKEYNNKNEFEKYKKYINK